MRDAAGKNKKTGLFGEFSIEIYDDTCLDGGGNSIGVTLDE